MKTLLTALSVAAALTLAAEVSFWKDDVAPDLSRTTPMASSLALATAFESRPYSVAVVDDVPIQTTVKGTILMFR